MPVITTGTYLKKEDLPETGVLLTIAECASENIAPEDKPREMKWVLRFVGDVKPLILNKVNITRLTAAFKSNDSDQWLGKQIVAYSDPDVEFGGKLVGGVRLRAKKQGGQPMPPPVPVSDLDDEPPF
jgi:hypothetical protein